MRDDGLKTLHNKTSFSYFKNLNSAICSKMKDSHGGL